MLSLYRPFGSLFRDTPLNQIWDPLMEGGLSREGQAFRPAVDVVETDKEYLVQAELPGMKPGEVEVEVKEGVLTLKGERVHEKEEKKDGYHRVERSFGRFQRAFHLPDGVNAESIDAKLGDGLLTVRVPKAATKEKAAAHKVEVKAEGLLERAKKAFHKVAESPVVTQ